jgi:cardiolipin synthase A/B
MHFLNSLAVILNILLSVGTAGHALLNKRTPATALGWIAVCLMFPVIGPFLYFLFGINRVATRARKLEDKGPVKHLDGRGYQDAAAGVRLKAAELSLPRSFSQIARISDIVTHLPLVGGNAIDILPNGEAAYPAMLESIYQARSFVLLATYIFDGNKTGKQFIEALAGAVERGVDVRVIIDGVGEYYYWRRVGTLLRRRGVHVARFIPPRLIPPAIRINLRNHRKILIVDGQVAYTGGMNIGDRHLADNLRNKKRVVDLHFRLRGPVVMQIEQSFLEDWAFCTGERNLPLPQPTCPVTTGSAVCRVITDGPNEAVNKLSTIVLGAISSSREQVLIMTPYFLPSVEIIAALQSAALRGVEVTVVLPRKNNLPFIAWATNNVLRDLVYWGVNVYYQPPPFVHTKLFIVDRQYVQIGSANIDPRSLQLNFELAVEIYDADIARTLVDHIRQQQKQSTPVTLRDVEQRPLIVKLRDAAMWLFSPYF